MNDAAATADGTDVVLAIGGMTCASCAMRIEKKLNRMPGVTATVNYATDAARVHLDSGGPTLDEVIALVEATGYRAACASGPAAGAGAMPGALASVSRAETMAPEDERMFGAGADLANPAETQEVGATPSRRGGVSDSPPVADPALVALRERLYVCFVLAAPVVVLAMIPALQFDSWQWLSLTLASPVVVWGGLPLHRAAWVGWGLSLVHGIVAGPDTRQVWALAAYGVGVALIGVGIGIRVAGARHLPVRSAAGRFDVPVSDADGRFAPPDRVRVTPRVVGQ
jgi:Cu+-exporting ATPase